MKQAKTFAVGLFLVLFVSFLVLAFSTTYPMPIRAIAEEKEGFTENPTRASDCQCLSGYLPSNRTTSKYGGKFIQYAGLLAFQPDGTSMKHLVSNCLNCEGINPCSEAKTISKTAWDSLSWGTQYTCPFFTQIKANAKATTSTFFCQSLADPENRRSCY